jgi:hypothetical protein
MTRKTLLATVTASLLLAAPALAQTPGGSGSPGSPPPGGTTIPGTPTPGTPAPGAPPPGTPGSITPGTPGSTTPGMPGINDPSRNPTFPCPPGQARRPGSTVCSPTIPGGPPPATR